MQNAGEVLAALQSVTPQASAYSVNEENLQALVELAGFCRQRGIALTFVFPPGGRRRAGIPAGRAGHPQRACARKRDACRHGAQVRDFECQPEATFENEMFYDGFHLDAVHGLGTYAEVLFGTNDAKEGDAFLGA